MVSGMPTWSRAIAFMSWAPAAPAASVRAAPSITKVFEPMAFVLKPTLKPK